MKKNITMLFCAGCGGEYNTRDLFYQIQEAYGEEFEVSSKVFVKQDDQYDLLIIVNGCSNRCIEEEKYQGNVLLINETNYKDVVELVSERIQ